MAITDLIPWKKNDENALAVRRREMDPFAQFRREIDQMFDGMLGDWTRPMNLLDRKLGSWMPQIDVRETGKEIRVTAELPGMEEKDIQVSLWDGALSIKGEKSEEHEEDKGDVHRSERQYGMFERTIPLPAEVDHDKVKATFKKGVLKIILPKTKEAQSNRRLIQIEG
ncbi:MAG TPA: Hsp20/alpha crystallin family protein [Chthoniobacterales bacterium]|jgi:HSP20 family protein